MQCQFHCDRSRTIKWISFPPTHVSLFTFSPPGGYETFYSQYPEFCIDVKPASQERTENERNINSLYEKHRIFHKPEYDQVCLGEEMSNSTYAWAPWGFFLSSSYS